MNTSNRRSKTARGTLAVPAPSGLPTPASYGIDRTAAELSAAAAPRPNARQSRVHIAHKPRPPRLSGQGTAYFSQYLSSSGMSTTLMPMFLAVPMTVFMADWSLLVLRSGSLIFAISSICAIVTSATKLYERSPFFERTAGWPEPLVTLAAFLSSSAAGGVLRMKVNERSSKTEISTGITVPTLSCVRALYSLQNHDVHAGSTERRADGRSGVGLAGIER